MVVQRSTATFGARPYNSPFVRVLNPSDYKEMRWKNGQGSTTELAVFREENPLESSSIPFEWRVSIAQVPTDGPFSRFEGIDRVILVLEGPGMRLVHEEGSHEEGTQARLYPLEPYAFSGDWTTTGLLEGGPVVDFNVMTRRGKWTSSVKVIREANERVPLMDTDAHVVLVYCLAGGANVRITTGRITASDRKEAAFNLAAQQSLFWQSTSVQSEVGWSIQDLQPGTVLVWVALRKV